MTIPVGYNPQLNKSLAEGKIGFTRRLRLKGVSRNKWVEADWTDCREAGYGTLYTAVNALVVLFITKRRGFMSMKRVTVNMVPTASRGLQRNDS